MRYSTLFIWGELPPGLKIGDKIGGKRCKDEVERDPEKVTPDGVQAKAAEVDAAKRGG
jgi:hypothetical protein